MLGTIEEIRENTVVIKLNIDITKQVNLINLHVVMESGDSKIIGEIVYSNRNSMYINIVGEIQGEEFIQGASRKPSFNALVRLIKLDEISKILGPQDTRFGTILFGTSNIYKGYRINVLVNKFFNSHFGIIGNSGSGKSSSVSYMIQSLFSSSNPPINSTFLFFDAYGEYTTAFSGFNSINNNINYKSYTTNLASRSSLLRIPAWLLDLDDLALLLDATSPNQLPIISKMLDLVPVLKGVSDTTIRVKNDIIARVLLDVLLSGKDSSKIRDQFLAILTKFNTPLLNLETKIAQPGYVRTLKQCLYIDGTGKLQEMELIVKFISGYILDEIVNISEEDKNIYYDLEDLELAMDFALLSQGSLTNSKVNDTASILSVRLHNLCNNSVSELFRYPKKVDANKFVEDLITTSDGKLCQIINFNINYIDDRMAKVIVKIISRKIFMKSVNDDVRASHAYHIIIEEAHRYVQKDIDISLLGYNIFERIAKEGRKYGVFIGLITQRPSELSDTCISQCSNFIIFRTLHPKDSSYIRDMVPNISSEILMQIKNLEPGSCVAFGSAFKIPVSMHFFLPNPRPLSANVDLCDVWYRKSGNVEVKEQEQNASIRVGENNVVI